MKAGQSALDVAKIALERQINHAVGNKGLAKAEVETQMQSMRAQADSEAYAIKRQAEAEAVWLTKAALELEAAQQLPRNLRMFLGPDIPRAVIEEPDPVRRPPALPGSEERDARAQAAGDQRDASEPAAGREQTSAQRSAQRQRHRQLQQSVVIDSAVAQEQGYVPS